MTQKWQLLDTIWAVVIHLNISTEKVNFYPVEIVNIYWLFINLPLPNLTQPNLTFPNQTEPNLNCCKCSWLYCRTCFFLPNMSTAHVEQLWFNQLWFDQLWFFPKSSTNCILSYCNLSNWPFPEYSVSKSCLSAWATNMIATKINRTFFILVLSEMVGPNWKVIPSTYLNLNRIKIVERKHFRWINS